MFDVVGGWSIVINYRRLSTTLCSLILFATIQCDSISVSERQVSPDVLPVSAFPVALTSTWPQCTLRSVLYNCPMISECVVIQSPRITSSSSVFHRPRVSVLHTYSGRLCAATAAGVIERCWCRVILLSFRINLIALHGPCQKKSVSVNSGQIVFACNLHWLKSSWGSGA